MLFGQPGFHTRAFIGMAAKTTRLYALGNVFPAVRQCTGGYERWLVRGERSLRFQGVGNQTSQEPDLGTDRIWVGARLVRGGLVVLNSLDNA